MRTTISFELILFVLAAACAPIRAADADNPFVGSWALTIPGGGAGWLGVTQEKGYLDASLLWGGGSVLPVANVYMDGEALVVTRIRKVERKGDDGKVARTHSLTETIVAEVSGDELKLTRSAPNRNGKGVARAEFTGKRTPPMPAKPDLSKVKYGEPIELFNGVDLEGWTLTKASQTNGWSVEDGVLKNDPAQEEGKRHIPYGNLRTEGEFEDFNLKLETNVSEKGNSGIYFRGIYEIQISDSYGKELDSHNMGGVYSRITPLVSAEKPAGQWQTFDITLVDRHITVVLNGQLIIDNEPLLGITGGALWSDPMRPGPLYLQGDHSAISYRNMVLTPVVK